MQNKESLYPKDWFVKASNDLNAARILFESGNLETAAFHIQQAIEKYLKGYLLLKGWKIRRIHELDELLDETLLYDKAFEKFRALCEMATEYYIEERYPLLISTKLNKDEIGKTLKETEELIRFIKSKMDNEA